MKDGYIIGNVYRTTDYSIFKTLEGNRAVLARRVSKIASSLLKNGYVFNPIVVNEKLEIIDGQARFIAFSQAGLPIDYVIAENTGRKECVVLNAYSTPWTVRDYIESYCSDGNSNYIRLRSLLNEFPDLPFDVVVQFSTGLASLPHAKIKEGTLTLSAAQATAAVDNLSFVNLVSEKLKGVRGGNRFWFYAVGFARMCGADENRLLSCVNRAVLSPAPDVRAALDELSDLYNWHLVDPSRRMYFYPIYEESMCKKYGWYENKWKARGGDR